MNHQGTKVIETKRLMLRPFTIEDAPKMYENWASDPEVTKFLTWPTHTSVEVTERVLSDWVAGYEKPDKYVWCLEYKETKEPIGSIGVVHINEKVQSAEVGYCISRKYWHQGITSEAFQAVITWLMEEVGVQRIEARHDPRNPHSGGVMKKCGLQYEGTRIRADWDNSGICDVDMYGLVKNDIEDHQPTTSPTAPHSCLSGEIIDYVGILAKLELSQEEKEQAKRDMGRMLDYMDKLNELDTADVEPMSHIYPVNNVFREDIVENRDDSKAMLANAPAKKNGSFQVPKTIE